MKPLLAVLLLAATGCAQFPRAELTAYDEAFDAARAAAQPMIAEYAKAERAERLRTLRAAPTRQFSQQNFFATFEPKTDPAAVSAIGLPPGAAALDRLFRALSDYNETLIALAEGRNIKVARAQLGETINAAGAAGAALNLPGLQVALAPVKAAADALAVALTPAIQAKNLKNFRRIVLDGHPAAVAAIGALRDYTSAQYATTISGLQRRWVREEAARPAISEAINDWHRVFGDYVVLLNGMEIRLNELRDVAEKPRPAAPLESASAGAREFQAYAEALRLAIAQIDPPREGERP